MIIVIIIICLTTWWVNKNKNTPLIDGQKLHTNSPGSKERKPNLKFRNGTHERKSILATFMIFFFLLGEIFIIYNLDLQWWNWKQKRRWNWKQKRRRRKKKKEVGKWGWRYLWRTLGGGFFLVHLSVFINIQ